MHRNRTNRNGWVGIDSEPGSSLNIFSENEASQNAIVDAADKTGGANTWLNNNFGTTSGI